MKLKALSTEALRYINLILAGALSMVLPAVALAASAGTQPTAKMTSAPAPFVKTPAVAPPDNALQPKVNVQVPEQKIPPATSVKQPPGIVSQQPIKTIPQPVSPLPTQPKVNAKVPNLPQGPKQNLQPQVKPGPIPPPRAVYKPARNPVAPEIRAPGSPAVNNAMVRPPKIDPQTLNRIQQFQEAATTAETIRQIEELNRAQQEMMQFGDPAQPDVEGAPVGGPQIGGNQPAQRESINDISNRGASGFGGGSQGLRPRGLGDNSMGQQQPSATGGLGTTKASSGFTGRQFRRNTNGGIDFKGSYSHDNGSTSTVIISTANDGAGNLRQITSVATNDANGDIIARRDTVQVRGSDGETRTISDTRTGDTSRDSDSAKAFKAAHASVNASTGASTGNTEEPGEKKVNPASQPNETGSAGKDDCNWNPIYGRCMNQRTIKDSIDSTRQPSRGEASTGNGTSYPVVGPDAVTDYEHGHRGANNRGQNVIEIMPDPPEDIDNQMGTLE